MRLTLDWEVLKPILPQHSIFVHVVDLDVPGYNIVSQQDGQPMTLDGPAPTGSWQTGEWLTTQHQLSLSVDEIKELDNEQLEIRVGLYDPDTGVRLPALINYTQIGDSVRLVERKPTDGS